MKKKIFLLPLLLAITWLTTAARPIDNTDPRAELAFKKQFAGAEYVNWTRLQNGYLKVSFVWGGFGTVAYFDSNAELVGSARCIFFEQLPLSVIRTIKSHYTQAVILEVKEIMNVEGTSYNLLLENNDKKYQVRMDAYGEAMETTKLKK